MDRLKRMSALTTGLLIIFAFLATGSFALRSVLSTSGSVAAKVYATQSSTPPTPLIILPSNKACVAGGKLTVQFNRSPHGPWAKVTIYLNGKRLTTLRYPHISRLVTITGLPQGKFIIAVTGVTRAGRARAVNRRYKACAAGSKGPTKAKEKAEREAKEKAEREAKEKAEREAKEKAEREAKEQAEREAKEKEKEQAALPTSGRYSGPETKNGRTLAFYVSSSGKEIQDVSVAGGLGLGCTPSHSGLTEPLTITEVPLHEDGSFATEGEQTGVIEEATAKIKYAISGSITGSAASGVLQEQITFTNGSTYECTTGEDSWSASYNAQGTTPSSAPVGRYSGAEWNNGRELGFYVSSSGKEIQDVSVAGGLGLGCVGLGGKTEPLTITELALDEDGSFATEGEQTGVIEGAVATFKYTFIGHLHTSESSGPARFAGVLREDVTYNNGSKHECTTGEDSWTASYNKQGATPSSAPTGTYSGSEWKNGRALSFTVSSDGETIESVSVSGGVALACNPSHSVLTEAFTITGIPLAEDGSFSGEAEAKGEVEGKVATFRYRLLGHLHTNEFSGPARFAGVLREDATFTNGSKFECTTGEDSWTAHS